MNENDELQIREATAEDAGPILEYLEVVSGQSDFLSFGPGEFDRTEEEVRNNLVRFAASHNQIQLVATIDDRLVGTLTFVGGNRPRTQHIGELGMSVDQAYWGSGYGGQLLDSLIDWAEGTGVVKKMNLRVAVHNHRAIRLYESRQFEREGTIRRDMWINGQFVDHHLMGRLI